MSMIEIPGVPFYSQRLAPKNMGEQGFEDHEEAVFWSKRMCALACLQMVLGAFAKDRPVPSLAQLLDKGLAQGAYLRGAGWIHQGVVDMAADFGMRGFCESIGHDAQKLASYIEAGSIVLASVTPDFKGGEQYRAPDGTRRHRARGGHIVVLYGMQKDDATGTVASFRVHHPHYRADLEYAARDISVSSFLDSFSDKGTIMVFAKPALPVIE